MFRVDMALKPCHSLQINGFHSIDGLVEFFLGKSSCCFPQQGREVWMLELFVEILLKKTKTITMWVARKCVIDAVYEAFLAIGEKDESTNTIFDKVGRVEFNNIIMKNL